MIHFNVCESPIPIKVFYYKLLMYALCIAYSDILMMVIHVCSSFIFCGFLCISSYYLVFVILKIPQHKASAG